MEALEALCSQLSCSSDLGRGRGLPGETPGDACTPGLWDQGTPAPWESGIRGRLYPEPLGPGDACTPGVRDQGTPAPWASGTPAPRASGIRTCPSRMTGPQALRPGPPSPQTWCSCGHCTEVSPCLLAWVLGNPRKSEKVTEATLRLESLTHSSLNGGNVTEARMGITLSKWMSGKLDILGMGQP